MADQSIGHDRETHLFTVARVQTVQFAQFKMIFMRSENPIMQSIPSLRDFPNVAFETVPVFVQLTMALSRPFKEDRLALPHSTPLSFRRSTV